MGSISGRKLNQVIDNLEYILAIELLYASQALEFRRPLQSSAVMEKLLGEIRKHVPFATEDKIFSDDIATLHQLLQTDILPNLVSETCNLNEHYDDFRIY